MFVMRKYRRFVVVMLCFVLSACVADAAPPTPAPSAVNTPSAVSSTPLPTPVPSLTQVPLATGPTSTPQTESDQQMLAAAVNWLRQNAIPLQSARSGAGLDDLLALKPLIGQARIVAVGQSAYDARAFVEMQQRVVQFAVAQMGFNVIAAELDVADANAIDAYIHGGDYQALSQYSPIDWRSGEMFNLLAWMRDFNNRHPAAAQLRVVGIGAPPPWHAIQLVEVYVQKVDVAEYQTVAAGYECLAQFEQAPEGYARQPVMNQVECWAQLKTIFETVLAKRAEYVRASEEAQFQQALANAEAVREAEEVLAGGDEVRQRFMAEHVRRLLAQAGPDSRVVLLAHNDFIGARSSPYKTMGALLRDQFGYQLVSIALDADLVRLTVLPSRVSLPSYAPLPPADSYEHLFALADLGTILVPLHPTSAAPTLPGWFTRPHWFRSLGEAYDPSKADPVFYRANLPREFDALLYIHDPCAVATGFFIYPEPTDMDFEDPCNPAWQISSDSPDSYQKDFDLRVAHSGQSSLSLQSVTAAPGGSARAGQTIRAGGYQGQRVRLTAYIKTQNVAGSAGLVLDVRTGGMQSPPSATQGAKLITGSQEWQQTSIELDVPPNAQTISYGVVLRGAGKLWLDELRLEILPAAKPAPAPSSSPISATTPIPASALRGQRVGGLVPLAAGQIDLVEGLAIFRMYSAAGPFGVVLEDSGGYPLERIFDEGGSFNGARTAHIPAAASYLLAVQAAGAWTIQIEQPDLRGAEIRFAALPQTFTGQGKQVSAPFFMGEGPIKFHLLYDGAGPFNVNLLDQDGRNVLKTGSIREQLADVSTSGPPSGPGNYLLDITAGGTYTITVGQ
jgi:erythromycin esterase